MPLAVCTPCWLGLATPLPSRATGAPATPPVEQSLLEKRVNVTEPVGVGPEPVTVAVSCTVEPIAADVTVAPCAFLIAVAVEEFSFVATRGSQAPSAAA